MKRILLGLFVVGSAACSTPTFETPRQHLPAPTSPTLTLYISNQSFDLDPVDIEVHLDGELAVTGDFVVNSQHTWIEFQFDVPPGDHMLTAETRVGGTQLASPFVMDDRKWGVLNFWYYASGPEPTPEQLSFNLYDMQPYFD